MKKALSMVLALVMVMTWLPVRLFATELATSGLEGKTLSILGDSISTYTGISNDGTVNTTLTGGAVYYTTGRLGVYQEDTWWQQSVDALGMELLVNNSWSGSCVLRERSGTVGAYIDRCVQLHNAAGEEPDLIAVYLGTNDFWTYPGTLGTADAISYDSLILTDGDLVSYAQPATTCEAYAIMLHKTMQRYPNAELYCFTLLPRSNQPSATVALLEEFNASLKQIAGRFGAKIVDLYQDSGIKADQNFQFYVSDNALHPGAAGMDAIAGSFTSALLQNSGDVAGMVYRVSYDLTDVIVDQGTSSAVLGGNAFSCSFTAPAGSVPDVTVTMGGVDVTEHCYNNGRVTIDHVTGDIQITAQAEQLPDEPDHFRWECREDQLVSITERGNASNPLSMTQGSITDGRFTNTRFTLSEAVVLKHDRPWIFEWKSEGTWTDTTDGALLLAGAPSSSTADTPYLYRRHNSDFISFGYASGGRYYNYGVALGANGIDGAAEHTYRLTNRILEDGTNMVYLSVDGEEIAPMNHHWIGGTDQKTTVDWVSGKDFTFTYMGTSPHTIGNCSISYIQVWEGGHIHDYAAVVTEPACTEKGYTTYICTCGDAYTADEVAALGHSFEMTVVAPGCVFPGYTAHACAHCDYVYYDNIVPAVGHHYEAIVTEPNYTGAGYTTYTCIRCADSYKDQITNPIGHDYTMEVLPATCTVSGYTLYTCTCGESYTADEVAPLGHSFAEGICTVCGEPDPDYVKPAIIPTLTLKAPALEFKDMICVIAFYTAENMEDVVEMGMITYTEQVDVVDVNTAAHVIPGAVYEEGSGRYFSRSQGIHAKFLGDTVYLACYAKLSDGTYVYTKLASYSAVTYATNQLKNSADMKVKQLVAAMLNYGAAAQNYFGYNTANPANSTLTDDQRLLPESYTSDMVSTVPAADVAKQGIFANNKGFSLRKPAVSFEGAFSINYFFTPVYTPADGITLYYWTETDYTSADVLTVDNATGAVVMSNEGASLYRGDVVGIAAKDLSKAVYVAAVYSDGTTTWTSGVLGYSIGAYCAGMAQGTDAMADLAMATAVYGHHAKAYFG